jgi:NADPH:quinone reductase-like Zn-dependent oxidoreductase
MSAGTRAADRQTPPRTATMRAVMQRSYGTADVLHLENIPAPAIRPDEVLIRVRAAAVNHADLVHTTGEPLIARLAFGLRKPKEPVRGKDVAGVIDAVGSRVSRFRSGDAVYAELAAGAFAEYVAAPEKLVARMPSNLTFEQAAAVPLSARTALQGLRDAGRLRPGQRVLINGASGGVGTFAVQIATALGARVTAVCSARNAELVRSLGADEVLDYAQTDFTMGEDRYDLIFDGIGNHPLRRLRRVLTPAGTLVLSSGTGGRILGPMGRILRALAWSPFIRQTLRTFSATPGAEQLGQLTELIEAGRLSPQIERTYPLSRTGEAARFFAEQHARAKIVIRVTQPAE